MNIFILDYNPERSVRMLGDQHVVKMPLETAQLLCGVFEPGKAPYKRTHYNHPCAIWARQSSANFDWLIHYGLVLCEEFYFRYGKRHKCEEVIRWCRKNKKQLRFTKKKRSHFALCVGEQYRIGNAVESYRAYYKNEKQFSKWERGRTPPSFMSLENK